jgi:hypothetical protein
VDSTAAEVGTASHTALIAYQRELDLLVEQQMQLRPRALPP